MHRSDGDDSPLSANRVGQKGGGAQDGDDTHYQQNRGKTKKTHGEKLSGRELVTCCHEKKIQLDGAERRGPWYIPQVASILCLHGYGVRSWFWDRVYTELTRRGHRVITPDLQMRSMSELMADVDRLITENAPSVVLGHSLGAAMAVRNLDHRLRAAVLLAPPAAARANSTSGLTLFLLRHHLIPHFVLRRRFFRTTQLSDQKRIFDDAVRETPELQEAVFRGDALVKELRPADVPVLVIGSEADAVIPVNESRHIAEALEGEIHVFPKNLRIGHNDLVTSVDGSSRVCELIESFLERELGRE